MAVHKLETWFSTKFDTKWPCPACHHVALTIIPESFTKKDTLYSQQNTGEYWFDHEDDKSVFSCMAQCKREGCGEVVACSREGMWEAERDPETGQQLSGYEQYFCPRYFWPALHPVEITEKCPEKIRSALYASFSVYLSQPGSAANLVRIAVEELLDAIGVPDINTEGRRMPLGVRLEHHIPAQYSEYADVLKAIKFLGNAGSHNYNSVSIRDIEDAYDIMEFVTSSLFAGRKASIDALAARLTTRFEK